MTQIQHVDILIVGSGPSGTSTALHLVKNNPAWASRIVVVDKAVHPREKLCGGGVTHIGQNILARLGLPFEPKNFEVREVRLLYQDQSYSFFGNPVFRIIRRDEFDHWLVKTAESLGITIRQGEAVTDVLPHDDFVEVITEKTTFHAQTVVAADGSRSFVRRRLKWDDDSRVARLIEVLTPENAHTQSEFRDGVAIFDFTPMTDHQLQGYYWDFPSYVDAQPYMNRGVFDSRAQPARPKADLKQTLADSMAARDREMKAYKLKGHPIRWWDKDGRFAQPRIILVGDAAGVDPLMGEGISFALGYGEVAAATLEDAFNRQDFSFSTYKTRLNQHSLFKQLRLRVWLARFAYILKYPRFFRAGWWVARHLIKLTRWRDPNFVPAELPKMHLTDRVQTT
ncbi:MAG: FAD-dependent monooxygenase [Anaerolineaceae bacterium]|nr:FAD-dependent monooxygenase [Anaerolineaceae bacterium]